MWSGLMLASWQRNASTSCELSSTYICSGSASSNVVGILRAVRCFKTIPFIVCWDSGRMCCNFFFFILCLGTHSSLGGWSQASNSWGTRQSWASSLRSHLTAQWGHQHTGSWEAHMHTVKMEHSRNQRQKIIIRWEFFPPSVFLVSAADWVMFSEVLTGLNSVHCLHVSN